MSPRELAIAEAFQRVTFLPASTEKRFANSMMERASRSPDTDLSPKQSQYLEIMAWRFRRQIPAHLVPSAKPEDIA